MIPRHSAADEASSLGPAAQPHPARSWLYPLLLSVQTAGAIVILWNGAPIYRQMLADPSKHEARPETLVWSIAAVSMIQGTYWIGRRVHPLLRWHRQPFFGHLVLFAGRLSFIFASSAFAVVFVAQPEELHIPLGRLVALVAVLFSMFCYTLELERIGRALQGSP